MEFEEQQNWLDTVMRIFHPEQIEVVYYWKKSQNKVKNLTWNFMTYFLGRKPACQTMLKALDISSALAWVASDQLKSLTILSDITVGRSAVHQEGPNYTEDQKGHVSINKQSIIYKLFWSQNQN